MKIAVLGAGSWGTTLSILLDSNRHSVTLWAHKPDHAQALLADRENRKLLPGIFLSKSILITNDLQSAVHDAELIVAAVPSQYLRSVAELVRGEHFERAVFVNVAKGIENKSLMTMSEVLLDVLPTVKKEHIATISGPSFAEEVAKEIPTTVVAASASEDTSKLVQRTFMAPYFRVY